MNIQIMQIADHYGLENQMRQTVEEMGELIQAICKLWRAGYTGNEQPPSYLPEYKDVVEELADVQLMIYQMIYLLGCEKEEKEMESKKQYRQLDRIWWENKEK